MVLGGISDPPKHELSQNGSIWFLSTVHALNTVPNSTVVENSDEKFPHAQVSSTKKKNSQNCENISSNWSNFIQKENKQKKKKGCLRKN
jgi:hypothetical protein